jgi:hypothetical protein
MLSLPESKKEKSPMTQVTTEGCPAKEARLKVRGWLLLLCVLLTILIPLTTLDQIEVARESRLNLFGIIYTLFSGALAIFSAIAGVSLWARRPNAVLTAKLFLLALAAFAVAVYVKFLIWGGVKHGPHSAQSLIIPILAKPLLFAAVWYSYLIKSKRVQATFPVDYSVAMKKL